MARRVDGPCVWHLNRCLKWLRDSAEVSFSPKALQPTLFVFQPHDRQDRRLVFTNWDLTYIEPSPGAPGWEEWMPESPTEWVADVTVILHFYNMGSLGLDQPDHSKDDEVTFKWTATKRWEAPLPTFHVFKTTRWRLEFYQQERDGSPRKMALIAETQTTRELVTLPVHCVHVLLCCLKIGLGSAAAELICYYLKRQTGVLDVDIITDAELTWHLAVRDTSRAPISIPLAHTQTFMRGEDEEMDSQ